MRRSARPRKCFLIWLVVGGLAYVAFVQQQGCTLTKEQPYTVEVADRQPPNIKPVEIMPVAGGDPGQDVKPLTQQPAAHDTPKRAGIAVEDNLHIVFTTDCTPYQNWQSEVLFYSWKKVGQRGRITRIVADCPDDAAKQSAFKTAVEDPRLSVYYSDHSHQNFAWANKPNGIGNFLRKANFEEDFILLLDPDMVMVKEFTDHIPGKNKFTVAKGAAIGQRFGIGGRWATWHLKECVCKSCTKTDWCKIDDRKANEWFSVGPPLIMHKDDWKNVAPRWVEYMHIIKDKRLYEGIEVDMYAYALASAENNLPHNTTDDFMVSNINDLHGEGWGRTGTGMGGPPGDDSPWVLHYCQAYYLCKNSARTKPGTECRLYTNFHDKTGYLWHKGHPPADILANCQHPLIVPPPMDAAVLKTMDQKVHGQYRHAYMLTNLVPRVNEALANYKKKFCPNWETKYGIVLVQPEYDTGKGHGGGRLWYYLENWEKSGDAEGQEWAYAGQSINQFFADKHDPGIESTDK